MNKVWIITTMLAMALASCQESLEDKCANEADEFTRKKCPARIDENIIIDSMTFDKSSHTLAYWYHLEGAADTSAVFKKINMKKVLTDELKNTTNMKLYKDAGYSFRYVYCSGKSKAVYFDTTIREKDYK